MQKGRQGGLGAAKVRHEQRHKRGGLTQAEIWEQTPASRGKAWWLLGSRNRGEGTATRAANEGELWLQRSEQPGARCHWTLGPSQGLGSHAKGVGPQEGLEQGNDSGKGSWLLC